VGPVEDSTRPAAQRAPRRPSKPRRRPRTRGCLLKGCERRFRPQRSGQRYCSSECGQAARQWSRYKAQQSYRETAAGKQKRNGQCRRYRERLKSRQQAAPEEAVAEPARVITHNFFRPVLRPPWLLRGLRAAAALAPAALLFARVPARHGTSLATRAAVAPRGATAVADVSTVSANKPDILIQPNSPVYIRPVAGRDENGCCAGPATICWS
jgi:hypothetical protein